jgi:hypothetical protein
MRYHLRTLFILSAVGPPLLAAAWFAWPKVPEPAKEPTFDDLIALIIATVRPNSGWEDFGGPGAIDEFMTQGCFVIDGEGNPDGPDSCGRILTYTPYAEHPEEDNSSPALPLTPPSEDPFAIAN